MSESLPLRISPSGADRPLTRDQKRFNALILEIEQSRATLKAWQHGIDAYRKGYQEVLVPLEAKFAPLLQQWTRALQAAMDAGRWARGDRQVAEEMLRATAAESDDGIAEQDAPPILEDLRGDTQSTAGRKSAAQQRREASAQRVGQSLREVYRKLASALHPDREPDPAQRAAKTALMARVNEANGRKDLLALLELQLEVEQIDAEHLARVDATHLKHYNKVLAEQAEELRREVEGVESQFRADFGLDRSGPPLDPLKLHKVLQAQAAHQRAVLAQLRQEAQALRDPAWAKQWIGAQRRYRQEAAE
ncbi:MAG: DnaJ protein [Ramlibacter sp.]|nr:DnaJ protein [Ramlibacter sp.]